MLVPVHMESGVDAGSLFSCSYFILSQSDILTLGLTGWLGWGADEPLQSASIHTQLLPLKLQTSQPAFIPRGYKFRSLCLCSRHLLIEPAPHAPNMNF